MMPIGAYLEYARLQKNHYKMDPATSSRRSHCLLPVSALLCSASESKGGAPAGFHMRHSVERSALSTPEQSGVQLLNPPCDESFLNARHRCRI